MARQSVCVLIDSDMVKEIDKAWRTNLEYNSRSDYILTAIREKISKQE